MFDILRKNNTPSNLIFPMNRLSQFPVLTESLERSVDPYADNKIGTTVNSFINSNDLGHSNNSSSPDDLLSSSSSTNTSESLGIIILLGLGLYSLSLITFFGNAMVVHVIRTEKKLRTVSNMFILSLAIADLTVGLIVMPISSAYVLTGDWIFGLFVCQFWLIIDYIASTASIFNLLILSLDRYWSIKSPLKYLCKRTKKRALAMIVVVWILAACWIIPIIGWHHWYNSGYRKHNGTVCETEFSDDAIFKVTTSVANFLIPMSLMVIIYFKIYNEIKRRGKFDLTGSSSTRNNGNCGNINTASVDGSSVRDEVAPIKGYRRTWSSSRRKTPLTNGSSLRSQRKLKNCYSSAINLSSNDCSPSTVPRTTIRIDQASSGETFTADGPSDLVDPVIETNVVSSRSENNLDSDSVHRYEQLIVLKAGSKAYSFEDYKDIEVQVEYIELNPTEPTNRVVPNQSAVDLLKARAARLCQRKTSKPKMSSKNNPSLHKESFKLDKQNRAKNKYLRKNRSTNPQCLTAKPVFTSSRSFHGDLSPDKLSLSSYRNVGLHAGQSKVAGTPGLDRRGSLSHLSSSSMQSHKNVIRRVESSRLRQEKKAARQLGVILGAFIICWLPYVVVFIVTAYCSCINHFIHTMAIWLGYFNSTINPFLYALCNDNFKSAFRKMLARITSSQDNLTTNQSHGASFKFFKSNYP